MHQPGKIERMVHRAFTEVLNERSAECRSVESSDQIVSDLGLGPAELSRILVRLKISPQEEREFGLASAETVADLCEAYRRLLIGQRKVTPASSDSTHPFLATLMVASEADATYETEISLSGHPWLIDHRLGNVVVLPGTAIAELVRATAEHHFGSTPEIRGLVFISPVVLRDARTQHVRVVFDRKSKRASVYCRPAAAAGADWTRCAMARISPCARSESPDRVDLEAIRARCGSAVDINTLYRDLAAAGLSYGPAFRGLRALAGGNDEAIGKIRLSDTVEAHGFGVHPALLDAALHVIAATVPVAGREALVPFEIGSFSVFKSNEREALVHARRLNGAGRTPLVNVTVLDADGTVIAVMSSLALRSADALVKEFKCSTPHRGSRPELQVDQKCASSPSLGV